MKDKKKLEQQIQNYVKEHKELQQNEIDLKDLEQCARECRCPLHYVMMVVKYGKLF